MDPWRYSTDGISIALRVTPRGGRDDIDGVETLANGRSVVRVRVRVVAEGGEANRAVTELLASALGVPKRQVRLLSGATSRLKQVAVDGDPRLLGETLKAVVAKSLVTKALVTKSLVTKSLVTKALVTKALVTKAGDANGRKDT